MSFRRMRRKFVVPAVGLTLGAGVLGLAGSILFESQESTRRGSGAPLVYTRSPDPKTGIAGKTGTQTNEKAETFEALKSKLDLARKNFTPESNRERAWLIHEMARSNSREARNYVVLLAERDDSDPVERLAAVSALFEVNDPSLKGIASTTTNSLVLAKINAVKIASARSSSRR